MVESSLRVAAYVHALAMAGISMFLSPERLPSKGTKS